ncbi:DNA methyltransferase [Conexibacter sp. W3-3-2]|uniref:MGMT family protein n=1 Tax=Conexibacter sp. W3-3-2 TaxID=2675227 RepID=UPI0012B7317E|nr:MGMT family protein [Conexibacter sp. W3-3-2]MTD45707.1 DNA methyltransferase [Conexibacter sp. W3-3-2]
MAEQQQEDHDWDPTRLPAIVAAIPRGGWMSYGDVARAAGGTLQHARGLNRRFVRDAVPGAHRVLQADGRIGPTALDDPDRVARRLRREGVRFTDGRADQDARVRALPDR